MIENNQDLFTKVRELIEVLYKEGLTSHAKSLENALTKHFNATEILGEIRISANKILLECEDNLLSSRTKEILEYTKKSMY